MKEYQLKLIYWKAYLADNDFENSRDIDEDIATGVVLNEYLKQ